MTVTRVAIADDSVLFREGVARILGESGFEVIGIVGDVDSLVALVTADPPDVAVVDLRMPPDFSDEGIQAAERSAGSPPVSACCCCRSTSRRIMRSA